MYFIIKLYRKVKFGHPLLPFQYNSVATNKLYNQSIQNCKKCHWNIKFKSYLALNILQMQILWSILISLISEALLMFGLICFYSMFLIAFYFFISGHLLLACKMKCGAVLQRLNIESRYKRWFTCPYSEINIRMA